MSSDGMSRPWGGDCLRWALHNRDVTAELPHPDENPWPGHEHFDSGELRKLCAEGVIERAGYEQGHGVDHRTRYYRQYRTRESVYRQLDARDGLDPDRPPRYRSGDAACPECGRTAFINVGDGLECKACGRVSDTEAWRDE
jgi:hypothetical protein